MTPGELDEVFDTIRRLPPGTAGSVYTAYANGEGKRRFDLAEMVEAMDTWRTKEAKRFEKKFEALQWQIENDGCAGSSMGETTLECNVSQPCGLCRARFARSAVETERDALRAEKEKLLQASREYRKLLEATLKDLTDIKMPESQRRVLVRLRLEQALEASK
jgi:hypothetical protein